MTLDPAEGRQHALATSRLPAAARQVWTDTPPRPAAHQLWRARWEHSATLVVLTHVDARTVTAVAVTTTPELADEHAVIVDPEATQLGTSLVLWDALVRELPVRVLDHCLGTLPETWTRSARARPTRSAADRRHEARGCVQDTLDDLAAATWVRHFERPLAELFDDVGTTKHLLTLPGLSRDAALELRRGQRPLTEAQARELSQLTSTPVGRWRAAGPTIPDGLVEAIDAPADRSRITWHARAHGLDEISARQEIAYGTVALAARKTGSPVEDWNAKLDRYLQAHEASR
jgi:hypothetical protein